MSNKTKSLLLIFLVLLADQILKFFIKTHFMLGDEIIVFKNWFIIHFVENNGMAFGLEFGKDGGKYFLSIFRLIAIVALFYYISKLWKRDEVPFGLIACFSLIIAGAAGNMFDSAFYGIIFNESHGQLATMFPAEGGYTSFLLGKVVDMFYFPLIETHYPSWLPFWGGQEFVFFRPVFNIADSSISIGLVAIFIFYRHFFNDKKEEPVIADEVVKTEETKEEPDFMQ
jgi:signal peptidase II